MAQIAQMQIMFDAAEDRLLMRLATNSNDEFRFWLTRRFVRALRPHLRQSLTNQPRIRTQANPAARRELLKFEQQQAISQSDFKTPYQGDGRNLPLGEAPMLLTRFQIRTDDAGSITLALGQEHGPGIDLGLNASLLHSLNALVDAATAKAEWDLAADDGKSQTTETEPERSALN